MTKRYCLNGQAGLVERRRVRQTGRFVSLINAEQGGYDPAGGPWVLVCEDHDWIMNHPSLALAKWHMPDPKGWCEYCSGVSDTKELEGFYEQA